MSERAGEPRVEHFALDSSSAVAPTFRSQFPSSGLSNAGRLIPQRLFLGEAASKRARPRCAITGQRPAGRWNFHFVRNVDLPPSSRSHERVAAHDAIPSQVACKGGMKFQRRYERVILRAWRSADRKKSKMSKERRGEDTAALARETENGFIEGYARVKP